MQQKAKSNSSLCSALPYFDSILHLNDLIFIFTFFPCFCIFSTSQWKSWNGSFAKIKRTSRIVDTFSTESNKIKRVQWKDCEAFSSSQNFH